MTKPISSSEALKTSWDQLAIEIEGAILKGYRNGILELQFSDSRLLSATTLVVGLMSGGSRSHFDNVRVTPSSGAWTNMVAKDGAFDAVTEDVIANLAACHIPGV